MHAFTDQSEGWGSASPASRCTSEYNAASVDVIRRFLAPPLFANDDLHADDAAGLLAPIKGHRMSKSAGNGDSRCRSEQAGSLSDSISEPSWIRCPPECRSASRQHHQLLDHVGGYLDEGYVRIKLKIEPGWDVEAVAAARERYGDIPLQVDANTAYVGGRKALVAARRVRPAPDRATAGRGRHRTACGARQNDPYAGLCLDESVVSLDHAADAIALQACQIINIKPGRVGGYLEAVRIHDLAVAHGMAVWCGMVETGLSPSRQRSTGRVTYHFAGDVSGSDRFFAEDITEPIVMHDGYVDVPKGPGLAWPLRSSSSASPPGPRR